MNRYLNPASCVLIADALAIVAPEPTLGSEAPDPSALENIFRNGAVEGIEIRLLKPQGHPHA